METFVLHIAEDGDKFKLIWTICGADGAWTPSPYMVDAGPLQQAANEVRVQLRRIAFLQPCCEKAEFASVLQKLALRGQELFFQLMPSLDPTTGEPSEIQQKIEQIIRSSHKFDLNVTLDTDRLFVPWGFVFSDSTALLPALPSISLADMKGFWLAQFRISIAYGGSRSLPRERKASFCRVLALHEDMFVRAQRSLGEECLARLNALLEGEPCPSTDWESFEVSWTQVRDNKDTVLYVFGHSDGQRIQLSDSKSDPKYELPSSSLIRFRKRERGSASIFMLNGCRTVAPTGAAVDDPASTVEPVSANFLKETRQPGYYGFIGTEAQVSNTFACRYGTEFLWRLCKEGKSVGEAFDELLLSDELFPQNVLYTCYADRKFRFNSAPSVEERP